MRVPLSWLREYIDFDLSVEELVRVITLHSQEIDGVYRYGVPEGEVVVGELLTFDRHPNADKLHVSKVDVGGSEVQIVTGAPNPYAGARVPVILPGSRLADGTKLKKAKLRGLESYGMMMSERELGMSNEHDGIMLLDETYETGKPLTDYFPINEVVLDIDVTPNRPDLWGVIGVARELAAILKTDFRTPGIELRPGGAPTSEYTLRVEAGELCPRYDLRRIAGVDPTRPTPVWMKRWIFTSGMRPIGAVVDASNFTMLETGQPNHIFDAQKVREGIVVRRANVAEKMTMLDGSTRELDPEMLVIADEERGLVVAGVMGAEDAEVSGTTTDLLVEVATFDGVNIMQTSSRLGLRTDASGRNERGLDPGMVDFARDRVSSLVASITGGTVADDTLSEYPHPVEPLSLNLRLDRAEALLGVPVAETDAKSYLGALGCVVEGAGTLSVKVPTFRRDLTREADLIEEVGRLIGLDVIPEELPATDVPGGLTPRQQRTRKLRYLLTGLGLSEAMLYPFGPDRWGRALGFDSTISLKNPLSADLKNLRTTLLPGLLDATARNRAHGSRSGGLFEVGRVYRRATENAPADAAAAFRMRGERGEAAESSLTGVSESSRVSVVVDGDVRAPSWIPEPTAVAIEFFRVKGMVERMVPGATFGRAGLPFLHPGRSAVVKVGGREVGWVGELHPGVASAFDLDVSGRKVAAFELKLDACAVDPEPDFETFYNVPAVGRDLAVVVGSEVPAKDLLKTARAAAGETLDESGVFDVYEGEQVPEGRKSVALSFVFRGSETLTDKAVDAEMLAISNALERDLGAQVRG
ncbi:phenylalanine--tRNA ligase subunit beta [Rubrobacter indicoceani]|uniref:phenylalanine--tRNA ligase subunit beta n=1 Tax=Rubrobacter indicoceani TaxID=2051957 RepID=UPI0013C4DF61|nr:phenylalanine--tRNA ligase subunit beta [Rubrobacter indicoceani]